MKILFYAAAVILIAFILDATRFCVLLHKSNRLVDESVPFQKIENEAEMNILVLGDSTAVGTGVKNPSMSTAGRLSNLYPQAHLSNLAQNGLRLKGLLSLLDSMKTEERYSLILVQIGANDIIRFTSTEEIETDIEKVLIRLSKQADKVVILHSGNVGAAPLFPLYMRPLLSKRSFEVREIYQRLSSTYNIAHVDLIDSPVSKLMREDPRRYYAEDLLHLSDEGYGLWFTEITKKL